MKFLLHISKQQHLASSGVLLCLLGSLCVEGATIFRDDFGGAGYDTNGAWNLSGGNVLQRTEFQSTSPNVSGGFVELEVNTYNANNPGVTFLGTEFFTTEAFERGTGITFEARARIDGPVPGGLLGAFFPFYGAFGQADEIDFELLSNNQTQLLTNVYDDFPVGTSTSSYEEVSGFDVTNFNTYRADWTPEHVQWYINGLLVRTETNVVPDESLAVYFSFRAPGPAFSDAYDAALQPDANPGDNVTYTFTVDYIHVFGDDAAQVPGPGDLNSVVPEPNVALLFLAGGGGLAWRRKRLRDQERQRGFLSLCGVPAIPDSCALYWVVLVG